jgi:serine/threonine-protein kinase
MHTTEQLSTALAGRYAIEKKIGEGGMATVYLARDIKHDRHVALKVLKPELGAVLGVERFLSEIKVTANLQHPNLLPLFDSGEAGGLLFYVMPFVEGESLRARLDREQQLPIDEAVRMSAAIASALAYAHERGVIHRDLKPENILLPSGQPVVADFGIALAVSNAGGARVTQTGLSLGTPQYMSPEQASGDRAIDARSDLYSLAAMTYEMIAGEPPHTGPNAQAIMAKLLTAEPAPLSSVRSSAPVHVELALAKALAKVPADRFANAAEFAAALDGSRAVTMSIGATRGSAGMTATRARGRAREIVAWSVAVVAIAVAISFRPRAEQPRPVTRVGLDEPDSVTAQPSNAGVNLTSVAISDDGTTLAYIGGTGTLQLLYVRDLAAEGFRQVSGVSRVSAPAFSPDGRSIAFLDAGYRIMQVPVSGGAARPLADSAGPPMWADDGNVYFVRQRQLRAVASDGGQPPRVIVDDPGGDRAFWGTPNVLPGSRTALIATGRSGVDALRISVVDLASGRVSDLGLAGSSPMYVEPGFIVFRPSMSVLAAVKFDVRRLKVIGSPLQIAERVAGGSTGCDCALARVAGNVVYRWRVDGSAVPNQVLQIDRKGVGRVLIDDGRRYDHPRVSPDGRRVALRAGGLEFGVGDIWNYEFAGGAMSRLSSDNNSYRLSWSRDGADVLWIGGVGTTSRVWRRPWDGSAPATFAVDSMDVAEYEDGVPGGWSIVRTWASRDLAMIPRDSIRGSRRPRATRLTNTPANETQAALSPDGAWVAYSSDESGTLEVYVLAVPGPGRRLTVSVGGGSHPRWSRDGKTLYYLRDGHLIAAQLSAGTAPAVVRRDSLFSIDQVGEGMPYDVLPNGQGFIVIRPKGAQVRNPYRTTMLMDWQSLLSGPAAGKAP